MVQSADLEKARQEEKQILQSLDRLLLQGPKGKRKIPKVSENEALYSCFELVLRALKVNIQEKLSLDFLSQRSSTEDVFEVLCEHAQIRYRQIKLTQIDARTLRGPIIGLKKENNRPVVLLRDLHLDKVEFIDVVEGDSKSLASVRADELHPLGYYFYRPLPKQRFGYRTLLRWVFENSTFNWRKVVTLAFFASVLSAMLPLLVAWLVDDVAPTEWHQGFSYIIFAFVIAISSHFLITLALYQRIGRSLQSLSHDLQAALVDRLLELSVKFHQQRSPGEIAFQAFSVDALRTFFSDRFVVETLLALFSFINFFVLFYYSVTLSLWVMGAIILYAVLIFSLFILFQRAAQKNERSRGEMADLEFQMLSGISKIRAAGAERRMFAKWLALAEKHSGEGLFAEKVNRVISIINTSSEVFVLAIVLIAFTIHDTTNLSMGAFLAFLTATLSVSICVFQLGRSLLLTLNAMPLAAQMRPIMDAVAENRIAKNDPGILSGKIDLMHLSFHYAEGHKQVLFDVNLSIDPGDFVALVGPSGSGKSTLVKLLLGFDSPSSGSIFFDGQDLSTLSIQKVRKQMGVVLQQGHLFPGSILDNIIGSSLLTVEDAWKAAARCALDEDIRKFPMGMYTMIGEGAGGLSGGQKQRILIARAIVRDPRILLFDEATSALDNVTQEVVTQSLNQLHVTRIVIAHRLSTIKRANKICVLQNGRIVEQGRYDELLAANGPFAELASRQVV